MASPTKKSWNLTFQPMEQLTLANREYGLMRIFNNRSMTPYPAASKGVDAETLRKRLSYQRETAPSTINIFSDEQWEGQQRNTDSSHTVHITISKSRRTPEHLLRGTPHPRKGKAVDPKLLIKNLEDNKPSITFSAGSKAHKKNSNSARSSISQYVAVGTPHPKKKIVLNPKTLIERLSEMKMDIKSQQNLQEPKKKKVVVISPELSFISPQVSFGESMSFDVHSSGSVSLKRDSGLSFEERRRQFQMGEFTIAKNGKKLCDWPLSEDLQPIDIHDSLYAAAEEANAEIEKFLNKQGIARAPHNTITGVRAQNRPSTMSTISAISKVSSKTSSVASKELRTGTTFESGRNRAIH